MSAITRAQQNRGEYISFISIIGSYSPQQQRGMPSAACELGRHFQADTLGSRQNISRFKVIVESQGLDAAALMPLSQLGARAVRCG